MKPQIRILDDICQTKSKALSATTDETFYAPNIYIIFLTYQVLRYENALRENDASMYTSDEQRRAAFMIAKECNSRTTANKCTRLTDRAYRLESMYTRTNEYIYTHAEILGGSFRNPC